MQIDEGAFRRSIYAAYMDGWEHGREPWDQVSKDERADAKSEAANLGAYLINKFQKRTISDGFGSTWSKCDRLDCGLGVTRPGSADCYGYAKCAREEEA